MEAHLDRVVLAERELEPVCLARVDWVCVKHLDVHKPVLEIVCPYECYSRWQLALHLEVASDQYTTCSWSYVCTSEAYGVCVELAYLGELLCTN